MIYFVFSLAERSNTHFCVGRYRLDNLKMLRPILLPPFTYRTVETEKTYYSTYLSSTISLSCLFSFRIISGVHIVSRVTLSAYIRTTVYRHIYRQNRSKLCHSRNLHNKLSDQNFDILFFTVTRRVEPTKDRVETPNIDGDMAVARFSMPIWPRRSWNFLMQPK